MDNRDVKIRIWREENLSQKEIAKRLGVSRQRVQQLEKTLGLSSRRGNRIVETIMCSFCGERFTGVRGRLFCSRICFGRSRKVKRSEEELEQLIELRRTRARERSRRYYHQVFKKKKNWKKIVQKRNKERDVHTA
jgi:transcriptional regulator with XRE-family HTH domain